MKNYYFSNKLQKKRTTVFVNIVFSDRIDLRVHYVRGILFVKFESVTKFIAGDCVIRSLSCRRGHYYGWCWWCVNQTYSEILFVIVRLTIGANQCICEKCYNMIMQKEKFYSLI